MISACCRNAMGKREPNGFCRDLRILAPLTPWRICGIFQAAAMSFTVAKPVICRLSWTTRVASSSALRRISLESQTGVLTGAT